MSHSRQIYLVAKAKDQSHRCSRGVVRCALGSISRGNLQCQMLDVVMYGRVFRLRYVFCPHSGKGKGGGQVPEAARLDRELNSFSGRIRNSISTPPRRSRKTYVIHRIPDTVTSLASNLYASQRIARKTRGKDEYLPRSTQTLPSICHPGVP